VFLELALAICRTQDSDYRLSTYVIPDQDTPVMREIVADAASSWPGGLHLLPLPMPERWLLPRLKTGWRNHAVQLITGTKASKSTHLILHDADLFLLQPHFFDSHFLECRDRSLSCLGVSPVWDEWFAEHGRHLAATWELCAKVDWLRSFPPYLHIGHDAVVFNEPHNCDTTLHPQALTPPDQVGVHNREQEFVHFNYVISTYREFQHSRESFVDSQYRLLLIRLFIDIFGQKSWEYDVPDAPTLTKGLTDPTVAVRYPDVAEGAQEYSAFRTKLERMFAAPAWAGHPTPDVLQTFDDYYGHQPVGP